MKTVGNAIKDAAKFELMKSVKTRVVNRRKEIEEQSEAVHHSVDIGEERQWITEPPKMFIAKLQATIHNGTGVITYYKYKTRENVKTGELEKHPRTIKRDHPYVPGKSIDHDVVYPYESIMKETIEFGKPTKFDEVFYEDVQVDK